MDRKLFVFNMVTVDGFFAGPNGELDWHHVDEEFNAFALAQLGEIDTLVFGRRTYDLMAGYWPTAEGRRDDPEVAARMNDLTKVVVSRTLRNAPWSNTQVIADVGELGALKRRPGRDLALFGSAELLGSLIPRGVVDEYRLMVNPVLLGTGKPLFHDERHRLELALVSNRAFKNGNVLLSYRPRPNAAKTSS